MNNINEELHVPDVDNVTKMIDEIIHVCKHILFKGLIEKFHNNDFSQCYGIHVKLKLSNFSYVPEWLDHNGEIIINVNLKANPSSYAKNEFDGSFKLLPSSNDRNHIEFNVDNEDFPTRLCNYMICINCEEYEYDLLDCDDLFSEMRQTLRHELEHAYEVYKNLVNLVYMNMKNYYQKQTDIMNLLSI